MQGTQQPHVSLTPMQQEMLKLPGNHLCGDAVTNVSCDELERDEKNNYQTGHANAHAASMADIARWTPPLVQEIASQGWTLIDDSEQERAWFASIASSNNPNLHELALKVAYKGLSGHASKIDIVRGEFLCGADGEPPDYLQEPLMFTATGDGIPMDDGGELPPVAIAPGSILAVAVTKSCKTVQSSMPSSR